MDAFTEKLQRVEALHHGGTGTAEQLCRALIAEAPNSAPARALLSDILRRRGCTAEANALLKQALAIDPACVPALCSLARAWIRVRKLADTARACAAALAIDPQHPEALAALGALRLAQRRDEDAEKLYYDALRRRPDLPTVQAALAQLLILRGRPNEAARTARRALALLPDQANVQALLGVALRRMQAPGDGTIKAFWRALALARDRAETCVHLSNLLVEMGRIGEAAHVCRHGLRSDPSNLPLWLELGNTLQMRADFEGARVAYRHAAALDRTLAAVHVGIARLWREGGDPNRASTAMKHAVALCPENPQTLGEYALLLALTDQYKAAEAAARRAMQLAPTSLGAERRLREVLQLSGRHADALHVARGLVAKMPGAVESYFELGVTLHRNGRLEKASRALELARAIEPSHLPSHIDAGLLLLEQGNLASAETTARRTLRIAPDSAEALNNLGLVFYRQRRFAEAEAALRAAVELQPAQGQWHNNLALVLLTQGSCAEGFRELEWRWNNPAFHIHRREFPHPPLVQARPAGRTEELRLDRNRKLLLWGEQGIGDEIIYAGLVPAVATLGTRCVLECAPRLVPLFARSMPDVQVVPRQNPPHPLTLAPEIAFHVPTGSLGRWILGEGHGFPRRNGGYLAADPELAARLRARYREAGRRLVVGISWRSKGLLAGSRKSTPLAAWDPILTLPGITFVNLQYGSCVAELEEVYRRLGVRVVQDGEIDQLTDMDAFAAQVSAMDMVVTTSNTTAHVAGALGVPVWTLLPSEPLLWYWFDGRTDSPWYPSMQIFRQKPSTDWDALLAVVAAKLAEL